MRWKPSTRFSDGRRGVAREVLESWGIDNTRFVVADGSGLSRYNYVTARTQPLAFAVLANNFPGPARPILAVMTVWSTSSHRPHDPTAAIQSRVGDDTRHLEHRVS